MSAGQSFDAVGFGETGDGSGAGTRRMVTDRQVMCGGAECARFGVVPNFEWIGSDGTCQGDSGGPALDDEGRVLGALSRGGEGCSNPVYSAVFGWSRWIREMGQYAATAGGYDAPGWVASDELGPPPPDTDGDGTRDPYDNCAEVANPQQHDLDADGRGDLCDQEDGRDGGGRCSICNGCETDEDCGPGAYCRQSGFRGNYCTVDCETDEVAASNVPLGTQVTVRAKVLGSGAIIEARTEPLQGELAASTASATLAIPANVELGQFEAFVPEVPIP